MSKIAIIGGGVAGLLAALELQKRDFHIDIYDQNFLQGNLGFGFLLMPNGVKALKHMGHWDAIQDWVTPAKQVITMNDAQEIKNITPVDNVFGISRTHFLQSLSKNIQSNVTYYQDYVSINEQRQLTYGGQAFPMGKYDWILGCDGTHSVVRKYLFPDAETIDAPTYEINGSYYDETFCAQNAGSLIKIIFDEPGIAVGFLPLKTGQVIYYVQLSKKKYPAPFRNADLAEFIKETLSSFQHPWIQNLLLHHIHTPYLWRGRILLGVDQYIVNNVVLMGDAAHIVLPFTSQGTNLAIEDVLSFTTTHDVISNKSDVAMAHFNNRRDECERIAFEGMEYAHLFATEPSDFMIQHMPLSFDQNP
jgi:2-polyprenyl-6-methoxyphenol hydroxylase-like FAD-dependent oxidoreductase